MRRVHRIVIHPDWQGLGLSTKFLNEVIGNLDNNIPTFIQTSSLPMKQALMHSKNWELKRNGKTNKMARNKLAKTWRPVKTASFKYRRNFGKDNR